MEFRLTYEGPLMASQAGAPIKRADHKHEIRKVFHKQLKRLWETTRFLKEWEIFDDDTWGKNPRHLSVDLARSYPLGPYQFVPLVTERFSLNCGLTILFLRADPPGSLISAGDVDNRIKTLIDALRRPDNMNELGVYTTPDPDEQPFYVLLENDNLVDRLAVETDTLLEPTGKGPEQCDARMVISVRIKPYHPTMANSSFL